MNHPDWVELPGAPGWFVPPGTEGQYTRSRYGKTDIVMFHSSCEPPEWRGDDGFAGTSPAFRIGTRHKRRLQTERPK